jgi:hypothetical protein
MPWTTKDAREHTKKATTPHLQRLWSGVANSVLKKTKDEAAAVRAANAAVAKELRNKK